LLKYGPVAHRLDPQHKFRRNITQSVFSPAARPRTVRRERSHKIVDNFEKWLREERKKLSPKGPLAQAVDYSFNGWQVFMRFLADGRICLSNNAAERALRGIAVGRKNWTFCGSDSGGQRAAVMYTLIGSAKLSDVDPKAWLADVLSRIADHPARRIAALLPWNWKADRAQGETPQGA
jgi:transposase